MSDTSAAATLWQSTNTELKNLFPSEVYEMWFSDLVCTSETESKLVLSTSSEFNAIWIENNFLDTIAQQARSFAGTAVEVLIEVEADQPATDVATTSNNRIEESKAHSDRNDRAAAKSAPTHPTLINPSNTFENFVVGSGCQLAHAASIAVANAPGRAYNPLFVFGETGLGKTHLMHAVAHQMLANNPNARIAYVSTEKFTN